MIKISMLAVLAGLVSGGAHATPPNGFQEAKFQGSSPSFENGVVTFNLRRGDCSPKRYGDGRGESDCLNGGIRSKINAQRHARLGQTIQYSLDIWIEPSFRYQGGKGSPRSPLVILEWQRINVIKNHMYELHLDSRHGAMFEDKRCFSPKDFGHWINFKMAARWSARDDGFLKIYCGKRLVYQRLGQNAIPPGCGTKAKRQCILKYQNVSQPIQWQVGPKLSGYGVNYKRYGFSSPFRPFPRRGLTMKVRNLYYGPLR